MMIANQKLKFCVILTALILNSSIYTNGGNLFQQTPSVRLRNSVQQIWRNHGRKIVAVTGAVLVPLAVWYISSGSKVAPTPIIVGSPRPPVANRPHYWQTLRLTDATVPQEVSIPGLRELTDSQKGKIAAVSVWKLFEENRAAGIRAAIQGNHITVIKELVERGQLSESELAFFTGEASSLCAAQCDLAQRAIAVSTTLSAAAERAAA